MKLKSLKYEQFHGCPNEWKFEDLTLEDINLIVGKNGSGKTRTLNVIKGLAGLISGDIKLSFVSGNYDVYFTKNANTEINYKLHYEDSQIVKEYLSINSEVFLERGENGVGTIRAEKLKQNIEFQTPVNELTCTSRRDSIQHPFFEDLFLWGNSLRHFNFGSQLGKDKFIFKNDMLDDINFNSKDTNQVIRIFKKGHEEFKKIFHESILNDMQSIGYNLANIDINSLKNIKLTNIPSEVFGLNVVEKDLLDVTDQTDMSQGMFRALSLLIQINYNLLSGNSNCILVDDIGEGLDYERSTSLIKLLISKTKNSPIQLIMSTNDRFVMNQVPFNYWSIIYRESGSIKFFNYSNSKEMFQKFEMTGLNNFDLFSSNYYMQSKD